MKHGYKLLSKHRTRKSLSAQLETISNVHIEIFNIQVRKLLHDTSQEF